MTARRPTNVPHSVHQRLLARARKEGRPLQELLRYFAIERFLFRLGRSSQSQWFLLKGALLLQLWDSPLSRPTVDIDLLGRMAVSEASLAEIVLECLAQEVPEDGIRFDPRSVRTEVIRLDARYQGVRVRVMAHLGKIPLPIQVDVGFGDTVVPEPAWIDFPSLLDFPAPRLLAYPPETSIAEKFHAMVDLEMANSRMKDFYDIWTLARKRDFDGRVLGGAIQATFERRETPVPAEAPPALTAAFVENLVKQTQWNAFLRKGRLDDGSKSLGDVVGFLRDFLMPPSVAVAAGKPFEMGWSAGGPWQPGVHEGHR